MVRLPMMPELVRQLFRKPATNAFPARYLPPSVTNFLDRSHRVERPSTLPCRCPEIPGKDSLRPESCIGCSLCLRVCPAHAIEFLPSTKRIRIYVTQCVFCSQCNDICPKGSLHMTPEFLLACEDRFAETQIVE